MGGTGGYFNYDQSFNGGGVAAAMQPSVPPMHNQVNPQITKERRKLGISEPGNYGGIQEIQKQQMQQQFQSTNQGSPINVPEKVLELQQNLGGGIVQPQLEQFSQQNYQPLQTPQMNQQMIAPMELNQAPYINQHLQQLQTPHNYYHQHQLQQPMSLQAPDASMMNAAQYGVLPQTPLPLQQVYSPMQMDPQLQQAYEQRNPRFFPTNQNTTQEILTDFYRKNVNSTIFNQRSRSHQQPVDFIQVDLKHQYARILDFQIKEQQASKARKKSEEKSVSPQQFTFFEKFGLPDHRSSEYANQEKQRHLREQLKQQIEEKERRKERDLREKERYDMQIMKVIENMNKHPAMTVAENLKIAESIPLPQTTPRNQMTDEYKNQLLTQIEEKKKQKEDAKKKRLEDEMKDDMRVKREMEELRQKYKEEIGGGKKKKNKKSPDNNTADKPSKRQHQSHKIAQDGLPQFIQQKINDEDEYGEEEEEEEEYEDERESQEDGDYQQERQIKPKYNKKQKSGAAQMNEFPTEEEALQGQNVQTQMDPMKKQLQSQLAHFQNELKQMQKSQKEMMKGYQKQIETLQNKKQSVIKDIKNDQETQMKQQIQNLQQALNKVNNQMAKSRVDQHPLIQQTMKTVSATEEPHIKPTQNKENQKSSSKKQQKKEEKQKRKEAKKGQKRQNENKDGGNITNRKQVIQINAPGEALDLEQEEVIPSDEENKEKVELSRKYNNDSQIILTPISPAQKKDNKLTPPVKNESSFQKQITMMQQQNSARNASQKTTPLQNMKNSESISPYLNDQQKSARLNQSPSKNNGVTADAEPAQLIQRQKTQNQTPLKHQTTLGKMMEGNLPSSQAIDGQPKQQTLNVGFIPKPPTSSIDGKPKQTQSEQSMEPKSVSVAVTQKKNSARGTGAGNSSSRKPASARKAQSVEGQAILDPDDRPIKAAGQPQLQRSPSLEAKRKSMRNKIKALGTLNKAQNAALPPKHKNNGSLNQSISNPQFLNEDNEVMSISNLLKKVRNMDQEEEEKVQQPANEGRNTPIGGGAFQGSILRKDSQKRSGRSTKSVRILDNSQGSQFQGIPTPAYNSSQILGEGLQADQINQNNNLANDYQDHQFFMGKQENLIVTDNLGTDYLQQTRDIEKEYYENILKPQKVKDNIESHQEPFDISPSHIKGIKISADQEPSNQMQDQLQKQQIAESASNNQQRQYQGIVRDSSELDKFTNFLYNKNLVVDNIEEIPLQNNFEDGTPMTELLLEEKPQYVLGENPHSEHASFHDYEQSKTNQEMKQQLDDIKRIIHENSRLSEEANNRKQEQEKQGLIEFNKSFQKNLKAVEDVFEENKEKKRLTNRQLNRPESPINLSAIKPTNDDDNMEVLNKNNSLHQIMSVPSSVPRFLAKPKDSQGIMQNSMIHGNRDHEELDLAQNDNIMLRIPQDNEDVQIPISDNLAIDVDNDDQQQQINQQFLQKEPQQQFQQQLQQQPHQFHLLSFLLNNRSQPETPKMIQNVQSMQYNQSDKQISAQKSLMHNGAGAAGSDMGMDYRSRQQQQPYNQEFTHFSSSQNHESPKHFSRIIKNSIIPQVKMNKAVQQHHQKSLSQDQQTLDLANGEDQPAIKLSSLQSRQQTLPMALRPNQKRTEEKKNTKKPPLPQIYQQKERLQQALTDILDQQNTSQEVEPRQYDSTLDVFTDNSRINEAKIPLNIYNPFFKEEPPANKVYDKSDPFLINLNLRKKLSETNQMIHVDNQNLLEKIQKMGKTIKPVQYGYPYIDLTKNEQDQEEAYYQQLTQANQLKSQLNDFMKSKRRKSTIDITGIPGSEATIQQPEVYNEVKYMQYNFNGQNVLNIKEQIKNQQKSAMSVTSESKTDKLKKFAESFNNELVQSIVDTRIKQDINLGQISAIHPKQVVREKHKPHKEFLEYLQDNNTVEMANNPQRDQEFQQQQMNMDYSDDNNFTEEQQLQIYEQQQQLANLILQGVNNIDDAQSRSDSQQQPNNRNLGRMPDQIDEESYQPSQKASQQQLPEYFPKQRESQFFEPYLQEPSQNSQQQQQNSAKKTPMMQQESSYSLDSFASDHSLGLQQQQQQPLLLTKQPSQFSKDRVAPLSGGPGLLMKKQTLVYDGYGDVEPFSAVKKNPVGSVSLGGGTPMNRLSKKQDLQINDNPSAEHDQQNMQYNDFDDQYTDQL